MGDIAVIRAQLVSREEPQAIANAVMSIHRNVKTVLIQTSPVEGDFRLRRLAHVAGENRTRTYHRESRCVFSVDLASCYFSPRLSHERSRIASLVKPHEVVVNMFAGVGCFSIIIAKRAGAAKVYSIDINPEAVLLMTENVRLNRVYGKVIPILGDAKQIIQDRLERCADRVLMPLPEKALEYLPYGVSAVKPSGGWIHVHVFEHAAKTENAAEKVRKKVKEALEKTGVNFEIPNVRIVRSTGPNWWQIVADVRVG